MRNDGNDGGAGVFERARPALLSLAYCMLGSRSEAEDAVQDSFVRWRLWKKYRWVVIDLNGARGVVLEKEGAIVTAISIGFNEDEEATRIYILRNPDKLASLSSGGVTSERGRLA